MLADRHTDRQTDRRVDHNTLQPYRGGVIIIINYLRHDMATELTQAHLSCDKEQQVNGVPVPTPVHSSPKMECGLLAEHNVSPYVLRTYGPTDRQIVHGKV